MAKTILLAPDIAVGEDVLRTLDRAKFTVTVALWLLQKERSDNWKLVIGTPLYDKLGAYEAYLQANRLLVQAGLLQVSLRLLGNRDPFVKALRKIFVKTPSVNGMQLGGQMIGDTWIDEGYIYRIK
jgi:hypothetical protein